MSIKLKPALFLAMCFYLTTCSALPSNARRASLSGGFIESCILYEVTNRGEAYGHLQATCNTNPADPTTAVKSTLDLNQCLANYDNTLAWADMGGAFASCNDCESRWHETRYLDCSCGSIDLNEGVYVTDSGALACFSYNGSAIKVSY